MNLVSLCGSCGKLGWFKLHPYPAGVLRIVNEITSERVTIGMCDECYSYPHRPGCPNEPEPLTYGVCEACGIDIPKHAACDSYTIDDKLICGDCMVDYMDQYRNVRTAE